MKEDGGFPFVESGGLKYVGISPSGPSVCRRFFLCRNGGTSTGVFQSLNLGRGTSDDPRAVEANWRSVVQALSLPRVPVLLKQKHTDTIILVEENNLERIAEDPPDGDAMITRLANVPLGVLTADCVPVIVCDVRTPALAVVHAGWRGTVLSVLWKTIISMMDAFGTKPEDCHAAIGPAIEEKCYEIDENVREAFVKGLPYGQDVLRPSREFHWFADLREANRRQLLDARLSPSMVTICPYCTHCDSGHFYSARRDGGSTGRQAAVGMLV